MIQQFYPQTNHNYKYELNKDLHLSAAHFIPDDSAGKCKEVHGHNYHINLTIVGNELNEVGFLVDFKKLKDIVHKRYDHSLLNNFEEFNNSSYPTTEQFAKAIHERVSEYLSALSNSPVCMQVFVRETPTSYVVYRQEIGE
ncbi:6-carboxytetrahydropterin synthase QueD [Metabacillus idriensis]|uniref:6-carboxytetrahydropterin synthase QueD n=1 Tax=Metabacillus idriensis TaxID=324768 RepID=UPI00174843CE|nr:6-carboxytetrahydropterin synthase QueD [Metabacillus idriensis]